MTFGRHLILAAAAALLVACGSPEERAANYVAAAQKYYDEGDYTKAKLEAQNAAQIEPKNAAARYLLAQVAEEEEDFKTMYGHLAVAVESDPNNVDARVKLGTLYFLGQAWDEAEKQVVELMKLAPEDARVRLLNARVLFQKGEREAGLKEVEKARELDPDNTEGIIVQAAAAAVEDLDKGLAMLDEGIARLDAEKSRPLRELRVVMLNQGKRLDKVEESLRGLAQDFPDEQAYQYQLARFYTSQGRVEEADKLLKQVTERDPTDVEKRLGYVQFLASQRDADKAQAALEAFLEETPDSNKLRLALGQLHESRQQFDQAMVVYRDLADRSPKSEEGLLARTRIAALLLQKEQAAEAQPVIDGILAEDPDNAGALLLRATVRFFEKKYDDAVADLRNVLRKNPEDERALLLLGQAYAQKGDTVLAKDTYRRALEVNPKSPDALRDLAALYTAGGDLAGAEEVLRQRLETQPDDLLASGRLVEVLMAQGRIDKAEAEARRLISIEKETGVGEFALGRVLVQKKDFAGAVEAYRKSLAARDNQVALEGLVGALIGAGRPAEAIGLLEARVKENSDDLQARYLLGSVHAGQGDQANAEKYLEEVVASQPQSAGAWASLARIYRNDPDKRIAVYQRALKAIPDNPELSMLLGSELMMAERADEAIALYESVLKARPDYLPAVNNLSAMLLEQKSDEASMRRALELAKKLSDSDNPALLDTLGWAHYRVGEIPQAVSVLERVVAKEGNFPIFRYHLGMAYLAAGNDVGARQQLEKALPTEDVQYPGADEARAALKKLRAG